MKSPLETAKKSVVESSSPAAKPESVTDYFQSEASYWDNVYRAHDVHSVIYQERLRRVLALVDQIGLPTSSHLLDLGCGAGLASVALAKRGHVVEAVDTAAAMLERTVRHAAEAEVGDRVRVTIGDVYHLAFPDKTFALVLAIGVIPWLDSPEKAIEELVRVIKPGGYLLVTADNRTRLDVLLDPLKSPALSSFRQAIKKVFRISWWPSSPVDTVCSYQHSVKDVDQLLANAELEREHGETLGFGPFTFLDHRFLPEWFGARAHRTLQFLSRLKCPGLQSTGSHVVMLARRKLLEK